MPYTIVKNHSSCNEGEFAVVKKSDGSVAGCHKTKEGAVAQIGAIESSEKKEKANAVLEKYSHVPYNVTTFEELDVFEEAYEQTEEILEAAYVFPMLVENALWSGADQKSAVARVLQSTKDKLLSFFPGMQKEIVKKSFMVYKDAGQWFWIARYSNNIIDDDIPQDIISSKSHEQFVEKVDNGEYDYPELWLWHEPEWKLGKSTWVAYDIDSGFALAAGYFYKWAYPVAEALDKVTTDWGLSHGMPLASILRDVDNPKVIVSHKTIEISPLPLWVAANKFTGFAILSKEEEMAIDVKKRSQVKDILGIDDTILDNIEAANAELSKTADERDLERKEQTEELPSAELAKDEEVVEEVVEEESVEETPVEETPVEEAILPIAIFTDEQVKELGDAFNAFEQKMVMTVKEVVKEVLKELNEVKKETKKDFEQKVRETPTVSLKHILFGLPSEDQASLSNETVIDGRGSLAKSKPKTAPVEGTHKDEYLSGDPVKNTLVSGVLNFKELLGQSGKEE